MILPTRLFLTAAALGCATLAGTALAVDDLPPIDPKPILEALRTLKDQQTATIKGSKQRFIQEATAAAANPARAAELWEEAIRATQFQGVPKENAQFKDWKDKEGDALKSKEVALALHLYFNWLSLTLQHSAGAEVKTLFPAVLSHVHEVATDQAMMDVFDEELKKETETPPSSSPKKPTSAREKEKRQDNQAVKRMHDSIVKGALQGSAFVQWMRLADILGDVTPAKRGAGGKGRDGTTRAEAPRSDDQAPAWESTPGSYDGIFASILLPEMRANRDLRVLEYWDTKLKHEADLATNTQRKFDIDKFNQVRRPQILWSRSEDMAKIGQANRAVADMFKQIKDFPTHPDAQNWIAELESMLTPATPAGAPAPVPSPGTTPSAATLPGAQ